MHTSSGLMEYIDRIGFLPLLPMGGDMVGRSAEEAVDEDCRYAPLPDGGWKWPLWEWKGGIIRESGCTYGKFFRRKAAFVSRAWWTDFCNYRRRVYLPVEEWDEGMVLWTLKKNGSMTTRDLRRACGFTEAKMRGKFDACVCRLEMGCYVVTENFVYPHDRHGRSYGGGDPCSPPRSPSSAGGACRTVCTPAGSRARLTEHFRKILPDADERLVGSMLK